MLQTLTPVNGKANGVDTRAAVAAKKTGAIAADIEKLPFDLSVLAEDGVFLNVDARGFGILDRQLDWQTLGISLPRGQVAFRPPRCGLLPDRCRLPLLRPAARAHAALHKYSYTFRITETVFETPSYRWTPWRAFEAFEAEFGAAQAALDAAKAEVLEQYDAIREEVLQTFLQLAADSARRLQATGHVIPDGFQDAVVKGVLEAMPTPDDLQDKLTLRYRVGVVWLGSEMLAEQRQAAEERTRLAQAQADQRLEERRQQARERLVQTEFWAEEERIRRQLAAEEEEHRREAEVKERLRTLKLEAARERLQEALSPLEEGARQLHGAVYEAATAIRASLQKHRYLPGGSVKRVRELSRWFALMNWQSDEQLAQLIAELERLARQPGGKRKRDVGSLNEVLGDIIELCYADAQALAEPNRMTALEV